MSVLVVALSTLVTNGSGLVILDVVEAGNLAIAVNSSGYTSPTSAVRALSNMLLSVFFAIYGLWWILTLVTPIRWLGLLPIYCAYLATKSKDARLDNR